MISSRALQRNLHILQIFLISCKSKSNVCSYQHLCVHVNSDRHSRDSYCHSNHHFSQWTLCHLAVTLHAVNQSI